jgi:hypothetical protein
MNCIRQHIAVLLLLLFCRVMVPDALIFELHAHTHTVHTEHTDTHKAQLGQKHKHCPVEELFGAPFQAALNNIELTPIVYRTDYTSLYQDRWHNSTHFNQLLRGPPLS